MSFLDILGYAVFFFLLWKLLESWHLMHQLKHRINDAIEEAEAMKKIEKRVMALRFEHIEENGHKVVLAYGKNHRFLGQGATEEDAMNRIQLYYPRHKILIVNDDSAITKILDPLQTTNG